MLKLIKSYPQLMAFGILTTVFSGVGQTFLFSLFIPSMREAFHMSQTQISALYSFATVLSAALLPFWGQLLDRIHLVKFTWIAGGLLIVGCVLLSQSVGVITVFVGFLLVRNLAQGTFALMSSTTMARIFGKVRGKALSITNLGYPLSEAVFPSLMTAWILTHGWRSGWIFLAGLVAVLYLPATAFLLRKDPHEKAKKHYAQEKFEKEAEKVIHEEVDWGVKEVIRDWRFYVLLLPGLVTPAFLTALFFHQVTLAEWKGWSMATISAAFVAFALMRAAMSLCVGPLIDRWSARKIFPFTTIPLAFSIFCFAHGTEPIWAFVYLALSGLTMGMTMTVKGALWAELYGTERLGSIRGFQGSLIVLSTASTPLIMGAILDSNMNLNLVFHTMIALIGLGVILALIACRAPIRNP